MMTGVGVPGLMLILFVFGAIIGGIWLLVRLLQKR